MMNDKTSETTKNESRPNSGRGNAPGLGTLTAALTVPIGGLVMAIGTLLYLQGNETRVMMNERLNVSNAALAEVVVRLGRLESRGDLRDGRVDNAFSEVLALSKEVGALSKEVGTLNNEVGTLKNEVGTLNNEVGTLRNEVGTLNNEVDGFRSEFNDFRGEVLAALADLR